MKVLELYSGIGGMHMALRASNIPGDILASIDINPTANSIYKHNFPDVTLLHRNIQSLTPKFINNLGVDTILMSPPCQPFTRNGQQKDTADNRTESFKHILDILPQLNVSKILVENVKYFENSDMRDLFLDTLKKCNFVWQEFILSPMQFGVPNNRHRYYCLAKKLPDLFSFEVGPLLETLPNTEMLETVVTCNIGQLTECNNTLDCYKLSDKILSKYANVLDICYPNSTRSCCFTKAYGRYIEGTGSVFTEKSEQYVSSVFDGIKSCDSDTGECLDLLRSLDLRFFTPKEICRLMSFPESFSFPNGITDKQKYMVLGNSINVKVVSELIKLLQ